MISKEDSVQTSSSADSDSDLEDLDDAAALSRSLTRGIEAPDKYGDYNVNMNASHPEKDKHSKEIYDFVDGRSGVDTIDHNFVTESDGIVQEVFQGTYAIDDENEPDIVKSTKTRTPPNTLQSTAQPAPAIEEAVVTQTKLRIQTENIVRKTSDSLQTDLLGVQQIPEPVVTPPSPTFQQPVAPPRRKKKMKQSQGSISSHPDELSVSIPCNLLVLGIGQNFVVDH